MIIWKYWVKQKTIVKSTSPVLFYFLNVATREFKIIFLLDSPDKMLIGYCNFPI